MAEPRLFGKNQEQLEAARFNEKRHFDKVIPLRISTEKWDEIKTEANVLDMSASALARMLILDGLRRLKSGLKPEAD